MFAQRPMGYLFVILILPISMYFWLRLRRAKTKAIAQTHNAEQAGVKDNVGFVLFASMIVIITLFISSVSIFSYITFWQLNNEGNDKYVTREQFETLAKSNEKTIASLDVLNLKLGGLNKTIEEKNVLGSQKLDSTDEFLQKISDTTLTVPTKIGTVTISSQNLTYVDVHSDYDASSVVVGTAKNGNEYDLLIKKGTWFYVKISTKVEGWIDGKYIIESTSIGQ